jgi:hypothetical protein
MMRDLGRKISGATQKEKCRSPSFSGTTEDLFAQLAQLIPFGLHFALFTPASVIVQGYRYK